MRQSPCAVNCRLSTIYRIPPLPSTGPRRRIAVISPGHARALAHEGLADGPVREVEPDPAYRSHLLGACVGRSIFGLQVNLRGENIMRFLVSKGWWRRAAGIAMGGALAWAAPALAQKAELLVYTALETDQ